MLKILHNFRWPNFNSILLKARQFPLYSLLLFLAIYTPFEEFILKWVPGPAALGLLLRFIPEIFLFILCIFLFIKGRLTGKPLRTTPLNLVLVGAFILWVLIVIYANNAPWFSSINNFRSLIRYIPTFYIAANIKLSPKQISILLKSILIAAVIEGIIVILQYFGGPSVRSLFAVGSIEAFGIQRETEVTGGSLKAGAVNGTFINTASLASFFLVSLTILYSVIYKDTRSKLIPDKKYWVNLIIMYFSLFASVKRMWLFTGFLIPPFVLFHYKRVRNFLIIVYLFFVLAFTSVIILQVSSTQLQYVSGNEVRKSESLNYSYFLQIFSPEYYEDSSEASRLWTLNTTLKNLLGNENILGISPNTDMVAKRLAAASSDPLEKATIIKRIYILEDVYWVAMLAYYGVPGLSLFWLMLYRLYRTSQRLIKYTLTIEYKQLGVIFSSLSIIVAYFGFVARILEVRAFAYYFWLLAGLVANAYYQVKIEQKTISNNNVLPENIEQY